MTDDQARIIVQLLGSIRKILLLGFTALAAWASLPTVCRSARRGWYVPGSRSRYNHLGFRLCFFVTNGR